MSSCAHFASRIWTIRSPSNHCTWCTGSLCTSLGCVANLFFTARKCREMSHWIIVECKATLQSPSFSYQSFTEWMILIHSPQVPKYTSGVLMESFSALLYKLTTQIKWAINFHSFHLYIKISSISNRLNLTTSCPARQFQMISLSTKLCWYLASPAHSSYLVFQYTFVVFSS